MYCNLLLILSSFTPFFLYLPIKCKLGACPTEGSGEVLRMYFNSFLKEFDRWVDVRVHVRVCM